jgi:tetratricopeptide (TPR) repeat protein
MIIGMDILRHLRIFMAFGEGKLYVTPAAAKVPTTLAGNAALQAAYKKSTLATIASMMQQTAANAAKSAFWNNLCFLRATVKEDLDAAAEACKRANDLQPNNVHIMDNIAFVLYQKGNYKAALAAYDANLALNPRHPDSLYMRGFAKGKLGDIEGKDADIAVAKSINPRIVAEFAPYDIEY